MLRNRIMLRAVVALLLVSILTDVFAPTVSWALTAGPTAPEASSFEPVDTTDMVNLNTGDFTYNIPLLEVPGPAGGYPLSLSYHAGIQPDEDASWVGLGWTLNPGAINRTVNGFADDVYAEAGSTRTYWEGGETKQFSIGVNVGMAGGAPLTANLAFSDDTYQGTSAAGSLTFGNVGLTVADNGKTSSVGITAGIQLTNFAAASATLSSTKGLTGDVSINNPHESITKMLDGVNSMGTLMSTVKNTAKQSILGKLNVSGKVFNSKEGHVSTKGYSFATGDIPTPFNFSFRLSAAYKRYKIDETENSLLYGSLYTPLSSSTFQQNASYDAYDTPIMLEQSISDMYHIASGHSKYLTDESTLPTGTFADYDHYSVSAQGLGGQMRPYHLRSFLYRQTRDDENNVPLVKSLITSGLTMKPRFRFEGDVSNRFAFNNIKFDARSGSDLFPFNEHQYLDQNGQPILYTGVDANDTGYNAGENHLAGSKHIEYYTNEEILDSSPNGAIHEGFMNTIAPGFERQYEDPSQIGGFKITNETGVTYHYSLPVYTYDEYSYSGKDDFKGRHHYNQFKTAERKAYVWMLTAVTGPDFDDRNDNGLVDEGDWGYWVAFEYGKWCGMYGWRTPAYGFDKDIDEQFETASKGKKEIYYLNLIKTPSHTAVFVKDTRIDGKGTTSMNPWIVEADGDGEVMRDPGGFNTLDGGNIIPASTLRLSKIYLFKNKDFTWVLRNRSTTLNHSTSQGPLHYGVNVIDTYDITTNGSIESEMAAAALKTIVFNTDYSLCHNTLNSFKTDADHNGPLELLLHGKLTLKSIEHFAKGSTSRILPPTTFDYEVEDTPREVIIAGSSYNNIQISKRYNDLETKAKFGDIVSLSSSQGTFHGIVTSDPASSSDVVDVRMMNGSSFQAGTVHNLTITKNPPYLFGYRDKWGFFKSDYPANVVPGSGNTFQLGGAGAPEAIARMTTHLSAKSVDAWSLRKITTAVGAEIEVDYESDTYGQVFESMTNLEISDVVPIEGDPRRVRLYFYSLPPGLIELNPAEKYTTTLLYRRKAVTTAFSGGVKGTCNDDPIDDIHIWGGFELQIDPAAIGPNYIETEDIEDVDVSGYLDRYFIDPTPELVYYNSATMEIGSNMNFGEYRLEEAKHASGQLYIPRTGNDEGGGIRVKRLSVDNMGTVTSTNYGYESGLTSFEPSGLNMAVKRIDPGNQCFIDRQEKKIKEYTESFFNKYSFGPFVQAMKSIRELPGPGVYYGKVITSETIKHGSAAPISFPGRSEYEFESLDLTTAGKRMVDMYSVPNGGAPWFAVTDPNIYGTHVTSASGDANRVENFSSKVGALKRVAYYNADGILMSETVNEYLHDNMPGGYTNEGYKNLIKSQLNDLGVIRETFVDARVIREEAPDEDDYRALGVISQRVHYPTILMSQYTKDYKNNVTNKTYNEAFDFYTGSVLKTRTVDEYGKSIVTETVPAYRAYPDLGLAINGGKNMLLQEAAGYSYVLAPNGTPAALLSAAAQTWSDDVSVVGWPYVNSPFATITQPGIWRQDATYSWTGTDQLPVDIENGAAYPYSQFVRYNFSGSNSALWQKNNAESLFDVYSHSLEGADLNGVKSAVKMSSDQTQVFATATNSSYNEFAYSGAEDTPAEDYFGGRVKMNKDPNPAVLDMLIEHPSGQDDLTKTHTGNNSIKLYPGYQTFKYNFDGIVGKKYRTSVWVNNTAGALYYKLGNNPAVPITYNPAKVVGGWYLLEGTFEVTGTAGGTTPVSLWVQTTTACNFDDFRVSPLKGGMAAFVYNKWGELSHSLNANNLYTEYKYDKGGRLIEVYSESFQYGRVKVSKNIYNYALGNN